MECVHCNSDAFNRIIINPTTKEEYGGLCEDCEESEFGLLTSEPLWRQNDGCGLCPSDADISLPKVDCLVEWDDGTTDAEYTIEPSTLHLCMHHLTELFELEAPAAVPPVRTRA